MKRVLAAMLMMLMLVNPVLACVAEETGIIAEDMEVLVEEAAAEEAVEEQSAEELTEEPIDDSAEESVVEVLVEEPSEESSDMSEEESAAESVVEQTEDFSAESMEEPDVETEKEPVEESETEADAEQSDEFVEEPEMELVPTSAEDLAMFMGFESVEEAAEYFGLSADELYAMSAEEIAALYQEPEQEEVRNFDGPCTPDELAIYFGMTVEELAEALEITVDELYAMTEEEIYEIYLSRRGNPLIKALGSRAITQYSSGFFAPMEGLRESSGYSGFIPNRVISESSNTGAHLAQDYVSTLGSSVDWAIMAIYPGTVLRVNNGLNDGAGRYVIIQHSIGGKTVYSIYQHLKSTAVNAGQTIAGGQLLGIAGGSGTSENQYARHLHLGIYSGVQDAWAPRLTSYSQNVEMDGPIEYQGTTYYNPARVLSGECVIGDGSYMKYPYSISTYENSTYKIGKGVTLRKYPYDSAEHGSSLSVGQTITSDCIVDNGTNYWVRITAIDGKALAEKQFIFSGYDNTGVKNGNQYLEYVSDNATTDWVDNNINGIVHTKGNSQGIKGTIKSSNTIKSITAEFQKGASCWGNPYKVTVNSTTYPLAGSAIDMNMLFGSLPEGDYKLVMTVEYYTNRKTQTKTQTEAASFKVTSTTAPSTLKFSGVVYPSTFVINTTNGWALGAGTVSSNYNLTTLTSRIVSAAGKEISGKTTNISGTSYAVKGLDDYSGTNNGVRFAWITSAGTYYWILTATDASGASVTLKMEIKAVASGKTVTSTASSSNIAVTGVSLDMDTVTLREGQETKLTATISPSNATNKSVTWSSSNTAVATVSGGTVKALKGGNAVITCKTADGGYTANCVVTVLTSPTGVSLSPASVTLDLFKNQTATLTATIVPSNASNKTLHWYTDNSAVATVENGVVKPVGTGTTTIKCMTEDGGYTDTCTVTVTNNAPAVNSVAASQMLLSNGQAQATYTVKTTTATTSVKMYSEDGTLIKTFNSSNASYSTSGSVRTWTLKYAFSNDGTRTMSFAASDGSTTSAKKACTVTLYGVQVKSAAFSPSSVKVGTAAKATIKTNSGANYLHMYSEDGNWIKTWTASSNSTVSGGVRTWNISYAFAVAGNRTMTFKASYDNANPKAGVTAKVTVTSGTASPSITSVGASTTSVTAKNTLKFTIKTPTSANYIKMYAENGGLVKTWSGNSYYTTSGSVRTWTLPYAFSNAGNRTVTFKASNSGSDLSAGKSISIKVLAIPNVTSASASVTTVTAKNTMTFTAKTPTNAYSLSLYAEDGSKVKTWNSSGNSTVSGSVRTWKVSYAFSGAGNRKVMLKASANGVQYGAGKTLAITVLPVPNVEIAMFGASSVNKGESVNIVVMSSTNGYYLHMFLEDGTLFKTWNSSGNSTVSGNTRVWQVPYTFSGAGTRKMTFKVSANNAHYGTGKTATIVVQ